MFKFSIRELMFLTAVVLFGVGWFTSFITELKSAKAARDWKRRGELIIDYMESAGYRVTWTDEVIVIQGPDGKVETRNHIIYKGI